MRESSPIHALRFGGSRDANSSGNCFASNSAISCLVPFGLPSNTVRNSVPEISTTLILRFFASATTFRCHRADENRPEVSDSKPATLKCGIHISSGFSVKGFSVRVRTSRGRAASLSSRPRRSKVRWPSGFACFPG